MDHHWHKNQTKSKLLENHHFVVYWWTLDHFVSFFVFICRNQDRASFVFFAREIHGQCMKDEIKCLFVFLLCAHDTMDRWWPDQEAGRPTSLLLPFNERRIRYGRRCWDARALNAKISPKHAFLFHFIEFTNTKPCYIWVSQNNYRSCSSHSTPA